MLGFTSAVAQNGLALAEILAAASGDTGSEVNNPDQPGPGWFPGAPGGAAVVPFYVVPVLSQGLQPASIPSATTPAGLAAGAGSAQGLISVDASTQAVTSGFGNVVTTLQTPALTPPAKSLIAILVAWDYTALNGTAPVLSVSDSKSGVYTAGPQVYDTQYNQAQIWWRYAAVSPGSMTATVTANTATQHGWIIQPYVLDGASPAQAGAGSSTASSTSVTQVP